MTQKHWENLVLLDARALTKEECASLREVADNVKAQIRASGQRVVVDPAIEVTVKRSELIRLVDAAQHNPAYVAAHDWTEAARGWLSHSSQENGR